MSAKVTELYMVLGEPDNGLLIAKVWLEKAGDLYVTTHAPALLEGKHSYHASGLSHHDTRLIARRTGLGQPKRDALRATSRLRRLYSWGSPTVILPDGYVSHADTKRRRTLIVPTPTLGWWFSVWAIEPGRRDLAEHIARTDPWPAVNVVGHLLAEWGTPWLLIVLSAWADNAPYKVIR